MVTPVNPPPRTATFTLYSWGMTVYMVIVLRTLSGFESVISHWKPVFDSTVRFLIHSFPNTVVILQSSVVTLYLAIGQDPIHSNL